MDGGTTLFAYGTLMLPEVFREVTGEDLPGESARAVGYHRSLLSGKIYPGMLADPHSVTEGVLYHGVSADSMAWLERFEDKLYERSWITVQDSAGRSCAAFAYIVPEHAAQVLSAEPWDTAAFRVQHLASYLERCRKFRRHGGWWAGDGMRQEPALDGD
ncbi:MAG: gamma-glutamylcyclotransferase [Bdellovibrionales bacterium]|nr:gamma-glutamylcyclotransferase [Bdellovibrionales bacterium]